MKRLSGPMTLFRLSRAQDKPHPSGGTVGQCSFGSAGRNCRPSGIGLGSSLIFSMAERTIHPSRSPGLTVGDAEFNSLPTANAAAKSLVGGRPLFGPQ